MSELLAAPVAIVERVVWLSAERGDGVGQSSLIRRLRELLEPQAPRTSERPPIELEQELWLSVLSTALLPSIAAAVLLSLDERRCGAGLSPDDDPWLRANADRYGRRRSRVMQEMLPLVNRAFRSCARYERTRKSTYLSDAVLTLESLAEAEEIALSPRLSLERCDDEAECLGAALSDVLPPFAFRYLVEFVTMQVADLAAASRRRGPTTRRSGRHGPEPHWFPREGWTSARDEEGLIDGVWFTPWLDEPYQQQVADARQLEEERVRKRAEVDRKMGEREAHREAERRKRTSEAEEAQRRNERQLEPMTDPVEAPVETKAQRKARADEQRNHELLEQRERDIARQTREMEAWRQARQQREEKDAEARRQEEEVERKRAAWEMKRRAKESPARIQGSGVRVEWSDPGRR